MLFKIHNVPPANTTHVSTSWYLVTKDQINTYLTTSTISDVSSTTNLLYWSITPPTNDIYYIIAVVKYSDNSTKKLGPIMISDGLTTTRISYLSDLGVETPTLRLVSNTFLNGTGSIKIESSPIRPVSNKLQGTTWIVEDPNSKKIVYSEYIPSDATTQILELTSDKIRLGDLSDIIVYCTHTAINNTTSSPASIAISVTNKSIKLRYTVLDATADNRLEFISDLNLLNVESIQIYNLDGELLYSDINSDVIPYGVLDDNSRYLLKVELKDSVTGDKYKRGYTIQTIANEQAPDVPFTDTPLLSTIDSFPNIAINSRTSLLINDTIITTKPVPVLINSILNVFEYTAQYDTTIDMPLVGDNSDKTVTVIANSESRKYISIFDKDTSTLKTQIIKTDNLAIVGDITELITINNASSNVAVVDNTVYAISNHKLVRLNTLSVDDIETFPSDLYSPTNSISYRVEAINANEIYIITNSGSILLYNLKSKKLDRLNSIPITANNSFILSTITSDGGLLMVVDNNVSYLYNRESDTITTNTEQISAIIVKPNREVIKVTNII